MKNKLVIMLKFPRPGTVKTRLVPALGERRACELYRGLVRNTLVEAARLAARTGVAVEARVADAPHKGAVREWLGNEWYVRPQGEGDLGQRMERAMRDAFAEGASSVVLIGADCPQLTSEHLASAFGALGRADAVLGPAADGGYYLIGMRKFVPELFRGVQWGSEQVLEQTLAVARERSVGFQLLETLHDLDRPEDLSLWAWTAAAQAVGKGGVSVVIPAYNEAQQLPQTLEAARNGRPHEIIVVDGGSTDRTKETARASDAIVLSAPRCRATQMNVGAAVATGEYLLFLHADTLLPSDYVTHVSSVLDQPGVVGGAFTFAVAGEFSGRWLVESTTNWRARRWKMPYGDQGLFLRREVFMQLGGFREMPIMEDYEFVRRLRRLGKIAIAPAPAITSARRWQRLGVVRTTLINKAIILAYHLGVSPARLAQWYGGAGRGLSAQEPPAPSPAMKERERAGERARSTQPPAQRPTSSPRPSLHSMEEREFHLQSGARSTEVLTHTQNAMFRNKATIRCVAHVK